MHTNPPNLASFIQKLTKRVCLPALIGFLLGFHALAGHAATTIRIGGTGAVYPILSQLIDEFRHHDTSVRIELIPPPLGSSGGIHALEKGYLDLAFSGRYLTDEERRNLVERAWVFSPLVWAVNGDVGKTDIDHADIHRLLMGELKTWPDGTPVRLVLRPGSDSDTMVLRSLSKETDRVVALALARPGMVIATHDLQNAEILQKAKGLVGTLTLCQLRAQHLSLQPLSLKKIHPGKDTAMAGAYPLTKSFQLVSPKTPPHPAAKAFIKFLYSAKAKTILEQNDCYSHAN